MINMDDLKIQGEPKVYKDSATDSGRTISRYFCGSCGTPVHSFIPENPSKTFLKMGVFADSEPKWAKPSAEVFNANRNEWEQPIPDAAQVDRMPPM